MHLRLSLGLLFLSYLSLAQGIPTVKADSVPPEAGSAPLDLATERRLERYLTNDNCPVTLNQVLHDRCQYLLKKVRILLSKEREGTRISPRAGGILRKVQQGTVVRRSVAPLRLRQEEGGFRRRLRTIQDVQERYEGLSVERSRGETRLSTTPPPPPPPPPAGE